jgi:putative tryptophan/tyrosine transport system substrate-binding protein
MASPLRPLARLAVLGILGGALACNKAGDKGAAPAPDSTAMAAAAHAPRTVAIIRAADWIGAEWSEDALRVGLSEEGLERGKDYEFKLSSAQGDLATLPSLLDAAVDQNAAVIVTLQDETLKAAVERIKDRPIVFDVLSDPFAAGAGTSDSAHLANVTGVYSPGFGDPEQERRVALIRKVVPNAKVIGVLFTPGEALSVQLKDKFTATARKAGLTVVAVPINTASDGTEATQALVAKHVSAIEIYGNAAHAAFESVIAVAKEKKIPVFSPSPFEIMKGATAALYPDFQEGGVVAGHMIGRILKGESPAQIPFYMLKNSKEAMAGDGAK